MKYFTRELWAAGNDPHEDVASVIQRSKAASESYRSRLEEILPRLPEHARRFFTEESLHDARVRSFSLRVQKGVPPESIAEFVVDDACDQPPRFGLTYREVSEIEVRHSDDRLLFPVDGSVFADWGYDEVDLDQDGRLVHSILFSSGMEIQIACCRFEWTKEAQPGATDNPDDAQRFREDH